jgi:hypothetical protein
VLISVGQQGQEARALDRRGELALIERLRARDATGNNLAGLSDIALEGGQILVVDELDIIRRETAELLATREAAAATAAATSATAATTTIAATATTAVAAATAASALAAATIAGTAVTTTDHDALSPAAGRSSSSEPGSSRPRSRRPPASSSSPRAIGEGSVTALSICTTR